MFRLRPRKSRSQPRRPRRNRGRASGDRWQPPDDVTTGVRCLEPPPEVAAQVLRQHASWDDIEKYGAGIRSHWRRRRFLAVVNDRNPPPDLHHGGGDWSVIEAWARREPVVTQFFGTRSWSAVRNRATVRRQYNVLAARMGNRSFWADAAPWVFMVAGVLVGLIALLFVVSSSSDNYTYSVSASGEAVVSSGATLAWVVGALVAVAIAGVGYGVGWLLSLGIMWRRGYGDVHALQLNESNTRILMKLVVKMARMAYANHSQSFGGPSTGGRGGLLGGYAVHITRKALVGLPVRAIYTEPLRGSSPDPMQWLVEADEHPFDGAVSKSTTAEAAMVQEGGEIKTQLSKPGKPRITPEAAKTVVVVVVVVMIIAILIQVNSGFAVGLNGFGDLF